MAGTPKFVWEARRVEHRPGAQVAARLCGSRAVAMELAPAWVAGTPSVKDAEGAIETWRSASQTFSITKREVVYTK